MCSTTTAAFLKHTQSGGGKCSVMTAPLVPKGADWCTTARTKTPKYWFIALFHSLSPPSVCVHTEDAKANKNQYPLTRHTLALSLIYCLFFFSTPTIFILIFSAFPSTTCSYFSLPSLFFSEGGFVATYLAEEMTSLCLSESRILARWEATESAYWVMWTWERHRETSDFAPRDRLVEKVR